MLLNAKPRLTIFHVLAIGGIVLLVGGLCGLAVGNREYDKGKDEFEYSEIGKSLFGGHGISYNGTPDVVLPPGFPIFVGLLHMAGVDGKWAGQGVSLICFFISLMFLASVSRRLFDRALPVTLVLLLFATHTNTLLNATSGKSESCFTALTLALVVVMFRYLRRPQSWNLALFSIVWFVLYLVRPEGLLIGLVCAGWMWFQQRSVAAFLRQGTGLVVFAILFLSYGWFLREHTGRWQVSGKAYANLIMGETDSPYQNRLSDATNPRYHIVKDIHDEPSNARSAGEYLAAHWASVVGRVPLNAWRFVEYYWWGISILGMASGLVGLGSGLAHRWLWVALWAVSLTHLAFFVLPRTMAIYHWVVSIAMVSGLGKFRDLMAGKGYRHTYVQVGYWVLVVGIGTWQIRGIAKIAYHWIGANL